MEETAVRVHRCRFIDFTPSPVTALAFPPLPLPKAKAHKQTKRQFSVLAVGHANGNIDLCSWTGSQNSSQSPQAWVASKTLTGLYPSKVDSLAFAIKSPSTLNEDDVPTLADLRLFSSGGGSELLEWDIDNMCVRRTIGSQAGAIWCIAVNPASSLLAVGCEDGSVRLVSLADDTLDHLRRFDRIKSRILSIAWGPPTPTTTADTPDAECKWTDSWLVTGGSDSSLRKWDFKTGRPSERMGTDKVRGERTLVWTVCALGDGTIVSGDSLGMVKFWDSRTCTQIQSFQGHGADVLCLTVSPEGTVIYSAGVDQKITQFSFIKNQKPDSKQPSVSRRWIQSSSRRLHSHDVRALATWPPYTPLPPSYKRRFPADIAPVLVSGGLDMSVVVTPAALPSSTWVKITNPLSTSVEATFEDSYHRRLAYAPGPSNVPAINVSRGSRLVSCMNDASISVWKIKQLRTTEGSLGQPSSSDDAGWEKLLDMDLAVHTNLVSSALSDDGKWLVVSDLYESKLFSLSYDTQGDLTPQRMKSFASLVSEKLGCPAPSSGGLSFAFTPDSSKLLMSTVLSSSLLVIDLSNSEDGIKILRQFDQPSTHVGERVKKPLPSNGDVDVDMDAPEDSSLFRTPPSPSHIQRITISSDGQWAATSDDRARTHIFNLDSLQHHCILPSFALPVQTFSFDPASTNVLTLVFSDNSIQMYDVEARQFPAWSKDLINNLSQRISHTHDSIIGISYNPAACTSASRSRYALLWGSTWMCKVNMDGTAMNFGSGKKRPRRDSTKRAPPPSGDQPTSEFKMITQYRPILFVDFVAPGELVIVERPLVDVLATLPPAYFKQKYGAS